MLRTPGDRTPAGWARLRRALRLGLDPHPADSAALGEYAFALVTVGESMAAVLLPEIADHLRTGCRECTAALDELRAFAVAEVRRDPSITGQEPVMLRITVSQHSSMSHVAAAVPDDVDVTGIASLIVVVDEDERVQQVVRRAGRNLGYQVASWRRGEQVLEATYLPPPACLMVAVPLPDMTAEDLQRFLAISPWADTPVVLLLPDRVLSGLWLPTRPLPYLAKPLTVRRVTTALRTFARTR